eukprot:gnl/Trimastix_PCT/2541.p1 GENE.gnl/Trimastix_PCT/2541~~gnl/Trimastix_PCT/2541.p1  ORF type:complete len:130 (+),score=23.29 gnl/Trimastix_PCT/2541:154-543(+)
MVREMSAHSGRMRHHVITWLLCEFFFVLGLPSLYFFNNHSGRAGVKRGLGLSLILYGMLPLLLVLVGQFIHGFGVARLFLLLLCCACVLLAGPALFWWGTLDWRKVAEAFSIHDKQTRSVAAERELDMV